MSIYKIDVSDYEILLENMVSKYNENKRMEYSYNGITLKFLEWSDFEEEFFHNLTKFEILLAEHELFSFLDLIHSTERWDIEDNFDSIYTSIHFDKLFELSGDENFQKLILERYYILFFKKLIKDYNNNMTLINIYNNLDQQPYLKNAITNFIKQYLDIGEFVLDHSCLIDVFSKLSDFLSSKDSKKNESQLPVSINRRFCLSNFKNIFSHLKANLVLSKILSKNVTIHQYIQVGDVNIDKNRTSEVQPRALCSILHHNYSDWIQSDDGLYKYRECVSCLHREYKKVKSKTFIKTS